MERSKSECSEEGHTDTMAVMIFSQLLLSYLERLVEKVEHKATCVQNHFIASKAKNKGNHVGNFSGSMHKRSEHKHLPPFETLQMTHIFQFPPKHRLYFQKSMARARMGRGTTFLGRADPFFTPFFPESLNPASMKQTRGRLSVRLQQNSLLSTYQVQ